MSPGRRRLVEVACGYVGTLTAEKDPEQRSTVVGSSIERLFTTVNRLSIPVAELRKFDQLFVVVDCGIAWEKAEGFVERLWSFGAISKVLFDPAKKIPGGLR
jgi:hypothetical protein